jgi:multiple sugar transport system substrate-binding protein
MKNHTFVYLLLLLTILLAACRATDDSTTGPISFMIFGEPAELAAYQSLVDAFQAEHADIPVDLRHVPSQADYLQRLAAGFSAGDPPDVMLLNYRRVPAFADQGGLEPVAPYLVESEIIAASDFYDPAIQAFSFRDQLWCIPQNVSSLVVYYNRDLLDAAGIPYPAANWTWDDFLATAQALTIDNDGDGQPEQYGAGIDPVFFRLIPFIWQNGGELVDDPTNPTRLTLDSPAALEAFNWFVSWQTEVHVVPDAVAESAENSESRFLNGRLAMYFNSRRVVPNLRTITTFTWDVAPLPRGQEDATILHSDGFCLAAATENKGAAWTFIEFANSAEGQTLLAASGRTVPSLRAVAESDAFLEPDQPPANSHAYVDVIPNIRYVPLHPNWPAIEEAADQEVERAFYGNASVEEAAEAAVNLTSDSFTVDE